MNTKTKLMLFLTLGIGFMIGIWMGGEEPAGQVEGATYICAMHPIVVSDRPGSCPICGMDMVVEEIEGQVQIDHTGHDHTAQAGPDVYRCSMHPTVVSDKPRSCPICGIDLVKDQADIVQETPGVVRIDPATVQNIGVKTAVVSRTKLTRTVRAVGRVGYDETRVTDVNTKVAGWVEKLFVDYTGQAVKKGQPLLEIFSPELVAAQEEYLTALDYFHRLEKTSTGEVVTGAEDLLRSARQRLLYWDITEVQIADLKATRTVRRTMIVYSPQEGVVVHKAVLGGSYIQSGEHLYRIVDLSKVWVYADVYEYELPWVKEGLEAEVTLSYLPGTVFHGVVTYVFPFLEAETRTVKVRMAFPNQDGALKPEMFANVEIQPVLSRDALVVPTQAVIHSGKRNVVVLDLGDGRFMPREIQLGVETDDGYEVVDGLVSGDRIVTSAQFLIDSESNLKAALASIGNGAEVAPAGHQH